MRLEITCQDRLGITQDVLDILVKHHVDLKGIEIDAGGKIFLSFPNIEFSEFQHLMPEIRKLSGVQDVKTTPFMPIERERNQLIALLETLPDPVFSIDSRGNLILCNDAVSSSLEIPAEELYGSQIADLVKGFQFGRWLEKKTISAETARVKFIEQDYLADILPVFVPDANKSQILAGAVIMLKSEYRLGQQYSTFHQSQEDSFTQFHSNSAVMKKTVKEAKKLAESDANLMLFGESGVGKTLLAKACHAAGKKSEGPFVLLNCQQFSEEVQEVLPETDFNDIFRSKFAEAETGTLMLKDVDALPKSAQQVLLSFLDSSNDTKEGEEQHRRFRLMSTTHNDVGQMVADNLFLETLFYRLNELGLVVPPLRERKQDIIALADSMIKQQANKMGRRPPKLSKSCVDFLMSYPWPGNARQMENVLLRAITVLEGRELNKEHLQLPSCASTVSYIDEDFEGTLDEEVKRFEKELLRKLYPSYPSTRQLAKKLGLSHTAIANKLREYGINRKTVKI
ncbi:MAG: sigma 54-interacting transcriptional regulator [Aestuariibacter sp.]